MWKSDNVVGATGIENIKGFFCSCTCCCRIGWRFLSVVQISTPCCSEHLDQNTVLTRQERYITCCYKVLFFHFQSVSFTSSVSLITPRSHPFSLSPCEGGQLLSDGRIWASDALPGVHARESSGDPQHLFLFHQLCRGSVGHIWPRLSLIGSKCLPLSHLEISIIFALPPIGECVPVHDPYTAPRSV